MDEPHRVGETLVVRVLPHGIFVFEERLGRSLGRGPTGTRTRHDTGPGSRIRTASGSPLASTSLPPHPWTPPRRSPPALRTVRGGSDRAALAPPPRRQNPSAPSTNPSVSGSTDAARTCAASTAPSPNPIHWKSMRPTSHPSGASGARGGRCSPPWRRRESPCATSQQRRPSPLRWARRDRRDATPRPPPEPRSAACRPDLRIPRVSEGSRRTPRRTSVGGRRATSARVPSSDSRVACPAASTPRTAHTAAVAPASRGSASIVVPFSAARAAAAAGMNVAWSRASARSDARVCDGVSNRSCPPPLPRREIFQQQGELGLDGRLLARPQHRVEASRHAHARVGERRGDGARTPETPPPPPPT